MYFHVQLRDLYDTTFYFCLESSFRRQLFLRLKSECRSWGVLAECLGIHRRTLFGLNRGWEQPNDRIHDRLLSASFLLRLRDIARISDKELERHITHIRIGQGTQKHPLALPLVLSADLPVDHPYAGLRDFLLVRQIQKTLRPSLSSHLFSNSQGCPLFSVPFSFDVVEELRLRGLKPKISTSDDGFNISYRVPGTNKRKTSFLPHQLLFDEFFAKQFGKWIGDRCGGPRKVGVANKEWIFISEFDYFLRHTLLQDNPSCYMTCRPGFIPSFDILHALKVSYCKTQYGDYAYRTEISNAFLRTYVFDVLEKHLFTLLLHSPPPVRFAFYAGLFEAEGSLEVRSKCLSFAYGYSHPQQKTQVELYCLLHKAVTLYTLLQLDGLRPHLSRKLCGSTLKYDVCLFLASSPREVTFIKRNLIPCLTHPIKLQLFQEVFGTNEVHSKERSP